MNSRRPPKRECQSIRRSHGWGAGTEAADPDATCPRAGERWVVVDLVHVGESWWVMVDVGAVGGHCLQFAGW